jgi:hypothetical protein
VDVTVVEPAQQGEHSDVGLAAVDPVVDVVDVAPLRWVVAPLDDAAAVADGKGQALCLGHQTARPPQVQGLPRGVQD